MERRTTPLQKSNEELAKEAQNPVANVISIPFQSNFNFGVGPYGKLQYVLNRPDPHQR
jgi:hypothetical protein